MGRRWRAREDGSGKVVTVAAGCAVLACRCFEPYTSTMLTTPALLEPGFPLTHHDHTTGANYEQHILLSVVIESFSC